MSTSSEVEIKRKLQRPQYFFETKTAPLIKKKT